MTHFTACVMLTVKPCGEVVEECAGNIITAFTERYSDLEAGNRVHDLLKTKTAELLSKKYDFRSPVTCERQHKKEESSSKLSKCRKPTPQRRQHTVHKQTPIFPRIVKKYSGRLKKRETRQTMRNWNNNRKIHLL